MRLTLKELKKCTVETLSGEELGSVNDIVFETEGQHIIQYKVKLGVRKYALVSRDQVARFEEGKVVVYDTALPKEERKTPLSEVDPLQAAVAMEIK